MRDQLYTALGTGDRSQLHQLASRDRRSLSQSNNENLSPLATLGDSSSQQSKEPASGDETSLSENQVKSGLLDASFSSNMAIKIKETSPREEQNEETKVSTLPS